MIIKFMLDNTYIRISYDGFTGSEWKVGNGVRQGGVLSSLLFNFYIDEAINSVHDMSTGCSLDFNSQYFSIC